MTIQENIKEQIKQAMLEKNPVKLDVLRGLASAFTNELVAKGKKPQETLSDEEALAVISRVGKQRKDSISQFEKAGRNDLAEEERKQYVYLEDFLPKLMTEDEIKKFIEQKIDQGLDKEQKGLLMKEIMQDLKGRADGSLVKSIIDLM